jgi:hypothetical protein
MPIAALFFLLGAAAPPPAPPAPTAPPAPSTLSMSGLADVGIGMTRAQVEALGHAVEPDDILYDPAHPEACWEGRIGGLDHVIAMFEDNHLVRLTVTSADIPIEGGARIGMAEPDVLALYGGRLAVGAHHYDADGHYLVLFSGDRARALVLETDGTKVILAHAGEAQAAQYVEGCL